MALNLADRIAVRAVIRDRCTAVVANYALYIIGNAQSTDPQLTWAREAIREPQAVGEAVSWYVLNQPDFINTGSDISDATLTGVVETALNEHFIGA